MNNHSSAGIVGTRQGSIPVIHSFIVTGNSALARKLCTIKASEKQPTCYRVTAQVLTPYNDGTATSMNVGRTGVAYNDILSAVDVQAAAQTTYAGSAANAFEYTEANVDVYVKLSPTDEDATVGRVLINIETWGVNVTHEVTE